MKQPDTYKEVRTITFPNMIARVYIPDLTPEERARRMQVIYKAAADLLRKSGEVIPKDQESDQLGMCRS